MNSNLNPTLVLRYNKDVYLGNCLGKRFFFVSKIIFNNREKLNGTHVGNN